LGRPDSLHHIFLNILFMMPRIQSETNVNPFGYLVKIGYIYIYMAVCISFLTPNS
jgi:hypothetical protein